MVTKYKTIKFEKRDDIGIISLNRPEKLNALSIELIGELQDCTGGLLDDYKTRVVILRGEGRAFCAGADLSQDHLNQSKSKSKETQQYVYRQQQAVGEIILNMRRAPQPIIGAIRGPACGGGFSLTLGCDIRIAGESARFNAAYVKIGFSGADMGSSYFAPRIIGFSRAAEYLYTGRFMDAVTAEKFGLVSKVVKDNRVDRAALELAREITLNSPLGIRLTKEALNLNVDAPNLDSAIHMENRNQTICAFTEDRVEGVQAFLEKRRPKYRDR